MLDASTLLPSLEESVQYLHDLNVRVHPVLQYVLPEAIAGLKKAHNTIRKEDEHPQQISSDLDPSCCLAFHEKQQDRSNRGIKSFNGCVGSATEGGTTLWNIHSTLKYYFADTIPKEHCQMLQAALIVSIHVWNRILPLKIEQTLDPSEATHLVQARDLSEELGVDVAAFREFPQAGQQRHLIISTAALTGPSVECLLSRFLHEMGHNMGFHHEFSADKLGVRIGNDSPRSIMGYDRQRIISAQDIRVFPRIYNLAHGTKVSDSPAAYIEKVDPYTGDDQMDHFDEWADLIQVLGSPSCEQTLDHHRPPSIAFPSSQQFVQLAMKTMNAAARELGFAMDDDLSGRREWISKRVAGITRKANCAVASLCALKKDSAQDYDHHEMILASTCLIQLVTQIAAVAIMKLKRGIAVTIGGLMYKPPMPPENSPKYTHKCAELHSQAFWEILWLKGLVHRESDSWFARSFRWPTRHDEPSSGGLTDTILEDTLATTLSYLDAKALENIKRKFRGDFQRLSESPSKCAYGFTNCASGQGDSTICRITFYKVLSLAQQQQQQPKRQRMSCGRPRRTGSRGQKRRQVEYKLHYESVTLDPHAMVCAFRASREVQSALLASFFEQLDVDIATMLYLEPDDVEQKSWSALRNESSKNEWLRHSSARPNRLETAAPAATTATIPKEE